MTDQDSESLLNRYVVGGDQGAANELFIRYSERLVRLASREMSQRLKRKVDPDDIVQSAYNSFFMKAKAGEFTLQGTGHLWPLLVQLTLHKIKNSVQHYRAGKRDYQQESSLQDIPATLSLEPSPEQAASLCEEVENLLQHFDDKPVSRQIIALYLQGDSPAEIAAAVSRSLERIRQVIREAKGHIRTRMS